MYLTLESFRKENERRKKLNLKSINEEFNMNSDDMDMDMDSEDMDMDSEDTDEMDSDEMDSDEMDMDNNDEKSIVSMDKFKELLMNKFNEMSQDLDDSTEGIEMLNDEQIDMIYNLFVDIMTNPELTEETETEDENEESEEGENEEEETEEGEETNEGLFGPSKEEIEENKKKVKSVVDSIMSKYPNMNLTYMEKGDNKQYPFNEESFMKLAQKHKFTGKVKPIQSGDKIVLVYEPGKTFLELIGTGASSSAVAQ